MKISQRLRRLEVEAELAATAEPDGKIVVVLPDNGRDPLPDRPPAGPILIVRETDGIKWQQTATPN